MKFEIEYTNKRSVCILWISFKGKNWSTQTIVKQMTDLIW